MVFLLLGSVLEHKAHIQSTDDNWKMVSFDLDQHPTFHGSSPLYSRLEGTDKASAKYFRLMKTFRRKYGDQTANLSGLSGNFSRNEELLYKLLEQKTSFLEKKAADRNTSKELHEKFRKQDLTHGLEGGRRRRDPVEDGEEDGDMDEEEEEEDVAQRPKRRRNGKPGGVQESVEFAEYKAMLNERAVIRDEERKLRYEEAASYNKRAEERQIKSLDVATATLGLTKQLVETSAVQTAALAKLLER